MLSLSPSPSDASLAKTIRRDRIWSLAAIFVVCGTAWVYLAATAAQMSAMAPMPVQWSVMDWAAMLIMWWVLWS